MEAIETKNSIEKWRESKIIASRYKSAAIVESVNEVVAETKALIKIVNELMMIIP